MEASEGRHSASWDQVKAPSLPQRKLVARTGGDFYGAVSSASRSDFSVFGSLPFPLFSAAPLPRFLPEPAMQRDHGEGGETSAEKLHLDYWRRVAEVITSLAFPQPLQFIRAVRVFIGQR